MGESSAGRGGAGAESPQGERAEAEGGAAPGSSGWVWAELVGLGAAGWHLVWRVTGSEEDLEPFIYLFI